LPSSRKDTKRRERKPATLHFLRRLYRGYPLGHPELHGYWDRIAATLRDRVDYLTWAGRDVVTDPSSILNETARVLLANRPGNSGRAQEQYDKGIVAIRAILGTWHNTEAEPAWNTLTPKARELLLKRRGTVPTYNMVDQRYEPQPLAAGLLKLIEEGEFGDLRPHTEAARENLRRRHLGQPQPWTAQPEQDADRDIDGYAERAALYRETHERNGELTPDLAGRLRTLAKRARDRGDLPKDFLNVIKERDRFHHQSQRRQTSPRKTPTRSPSSLKKADCERKIWMTCQHCDRRSEVEVPDWNARAKIVETLLNQGFGRPPSGDADGGGGFILKRVIVEPGGATTITQANPEPPSAHRD
jgi:hypothetical protein